MYSTYMLVRMRSQLGYLQAQAVCSFAGIFFWFVVMILILVSGGVQGEEGTSEEWPASCSRRDANLFLRGVKRFGTIDRLPDIAAEIGPSFESIPDAARSATTIITT